ncbi:hypothetical protein ABMA27_007698, partial [Loxostege sticticalis]
MESSFVDEREDVQKKTFAKWINSQLVKNDKPLVEDLFLDLRDGEVLLSLLEILTAQQYKRERGRMRVHQINNVNTALSVLDTNGVKLVNISSNDIVDGNPKLTLGLVWSIILHWQVHYHLKDLMSELQQTNLEKTLLAWCRTHTQNYVGVNIKNFTSSWSDGLAFNALLHRWRPQLFDYSSLVRRSPSARLDHAFALARTHLAIPRLLDPEDVNTPHPDKKSIMMYVMCMFQSLPHSSEDVADLDSLPSEPSTPRAETSEPQPEVSASRPLSTATTASVELGGYGAAMEDALAWLLEAEERLSLARPPDPRAPLQDLKEHFHRHERFLLELAEQQSRVGGVLEAGARLLAEGGLTREEAAEVRLQGRLLTQRWEELRTHAMEHQALVHTALMKKQQQHLDEFRQWLTKTEDRISHMGSLSGSPTHIQAQLHAVQALHADLRRQQPLVDALADCVVVVDDDAAQQLDTVTEIEDQLTALGERWSHTCQWTLQQLERLQTLQSRWATHTDLLRACDEHETALKEMEANPVSEIGAVVSRIEQLQRIKCALAAQQAALAAHYDAVQALLAGASTESTGTGEQGLVERAEALQDRLDALNMILDVQAQRIKELGFEFDVVESKEKAEASTPMDTESSPTSTSTMSSAPTSPAPREEQRGSKKPRLSDPPPPVAPSDFQIGYRVFDTWADNAEKILEECKSSLESRSNKRKEIPAVLERVAKEIEVQRADFANVEEIQRRLASEAGLEEDAKQHAASIEELKRRWENIQRTLLEIRNTMNLLEDKENFYKNIEAFQKELDEIHEWKDKFLAERPTNNQLIHLRNKIRALKQLEMKLKELNAQSIILLTKSIPKSHKDDIEADSKRVNDAYEQLLTHLSTKEVEIKLALNKKPGEKHENDFKGLQAKIERIESQIIAEHAMICEKDKMEEKLKELTQLKKELEELQNTYDSVVKERREKYVKGSMEELNFRSSLENLVMRYGDSKTILEQKISKIEKGLNLLNQLEDDTQELKQWLDNLDEFVTENSSIPVGDVEQLDRLIDASNKYDEEKKKYLTKLEAIQTAKDTILEDCDDSLSKNIQANTKDLKTRFDTITDKSFKLNESLRRALERTEGVFRKIEEIEAWLQDIEEQSPKEDECQITDSAELYQMKARFQTLKDKCDDKTPEFRNLNEASNDILLQAEASPPAALAKRVTHLNARWTQVTHGVYERYKVLAEAWHETGELRAWLTQEAAWLDGLRRRLRRSPNAPADAEEITDELYDLENYIQNHSDDRLSRIQDIGRQLIDAHIMPAWIRAEIDSVTGAWDSLRTQAQARLQLLERSAREAAQSEVSLDNLQQWLDDAHSLLSNTSNAPEDQERLSEEFSRQRQVLEEVQQQVLAYREAGKHEASARLQEQLDLVMRKFTAAEERLASLGGSRPVEEGDDLSSRLTRATNTLREVHKSAAAGLQLAGATPDAVRHQLRRCLKFYRTLSEIKSEVEKIIKSGRRAVEAGGVAAPAEFSRRIDQLKELYNRLGAQVTDAKGKLEGALLAARELHADLGELSGRLDALTASAAPAAAPARQALELELSRLEAARARLNANYNHFAELADPAHLQELKQQVDDINARWEAVRRRAGGSARTEPDSLRKFISDADTELSKPTLPSTNRLNQLEKDLKAKATDVQATEDTALIETYERLLKKIAAAARPAKEDVVEYEKVTDTIKRRLESPVDTPDSEKPELKKSKIPLALNSPVPIRREVKEGGCRSRGSSLERAKSKASSPCTDSLVSGMSFDSIEPPPSLPSTPGTPKKDSSTFNLLKDSDLFTQISKNKIEPSQPKMVLDDKPKASPCHVVAITEHEIVKATVSSPEPANNIETAMEFVPQRVETVEIIDDTEGETASGSSDGEEKPEERRPSVDLGSEPKTFVVEVRTLEQRMRPTLGVIKRKSAEEQTNVPDLIPSVEKQNECDFSTRTPPSTPMEEGEVAPLDDPSLKHNVQHLREDEVNEYLILEDTAREPNPPTEEVKEPDTEVKADVPEYTYPSDSSAKSAENEQKEEEVIYSEVEEAPQNAVSPGQPLCTSTPVRGATVVGVSHKRGTPPASPTASTLSEKYQRTDDYDDKASETTEASESRDTTESEEATLRARFGAGADAGVCAWAGRAAAMCRRMDVMLLTLAAAGAERDPGKRLEILKNQLGAIAPDAAELISRGDSLVYDKHKDDPLLADYIQTHYQDKLRNKWSVVMSEIETKRNLAMKAEDDIKELSRLTDEIKKASVDTAALSAADENDRAQLDAAADQAQAIARDLRAQKVAFDERALGEALAAWNRVTEALARDNNQKPDGVEIRAAEFVTRVNRVRECIAAAGALLRAPPLGTRDYDDFPLQEDALARVKSAIGEATSSSAECEKEFAWVARRARPDSRARAQRLRDKLRDELQQLTTAFDERRDKWSKCQTVWAGLYAALEECGEWLDGCERALAQASDPNLPFKDLKQKMTSRQQQVTAARTSGRAVVSACGVPLARDVQDQLDALNERWHNAQAKLHQLKSRISTQEATAVMREGSASWAGGARTQLQHVRDLLHHTSPNPSDHTSLSIRLSLVKARDEEVSNRLRDMEVLRGSKHPPSGEHFAQLHQQLEKARDELSAHAALVGGKLSALGKYTARLNAAAAWAQDARARLQQAQALPASEKQEAMAELAAEVRSHETEVREVVENYNNMERECAAAKQTVAGELRDALHALTTHWEQLTRATAAAAQTVTATHAGSATHTGSATPELRRGSADSQAQ